jgi:3-keto-5-aminohexanoate cleavage enzyme
MLESWRYADSYEWMERATTGFAPLVITCCVNGGVQGKEASAAIPETPEEIARSVHEAYNAGASAVHVHVRNPANWAETSSDPEFNYQVNARIRQLCPDIIINNTTGGGATTTMEDRFRMLAAEPEMASLNMGPDMSRFRLGARSEPLLHPRPEEVWDGCIPFTYGIIEGLATKMLELGIRPELEIYHPGEYWVTRDLIERGLISPPYVHQFVMGYQTSSFPSPANVIELIRELPTGSVYAVAAIGVFQLPLTTVSILLGGHVRVGLEDNIYYSRGRRFTSNAEAVERTVRIARELNREVAGPAQARAIFGLSSEPTTYEKAPKAASADLK